MITVQCYGFNQTFVLQAFAQQIFHALDGLGIMDLTVTVVTSICNDEKGSGYPYLILVSALDSRTATMLSRLRALGYKVGFMQLTFAIS